MSVDLSFFRRSRCVVGAFLGTMVFSFFPCAGASDNPADPHKTGIAIEQAMRTWQERRFAVTGRELIVWTDPSGVPVDHYPEDGTFPCDSYTDEEMVSLVQQLADAMVDGETVPGRSYIGTDGRPKDWRYPDLARFVLQPYGGDVQGLRNFTTAADQVFFRPPVGLLVYEDVLPGTPFKDINDTNYREKFSAICELLAQLDVGFFLNGDFHKTDGRSGLATGVVFSEVAAEALEEYRDSPGPGSAVFPSWVFQGSSTTDGFSAHIISTSGYFSVDRASSHARNRFGSQQEVAVFVRRGDRGPPRAPESNYPQTISPDFVRIGAVADGGIFSTPEFAPPPPGEISIAGLTAFGPGGAPSFSGWIVDCYVLVRNGWKYSIDSVEGDCGCSTCSDQKCEPGTPKAGVGSVEFSVSLGFEADRTLGQLELRADTPSLLLSRPESLIRRINGEVRSVFDYPPEVVAEVETDALSLNRRPFRQLQAPSWVADVVDLAAAGYRLEFFQRDGLPEPDSESGIVDVSGGTPFRSLFFEHVGGDVNHFQVTEFQSDGPTRVFRYDYDPDTHGWTLTTGSGADEKRESVIREDDGFEWTETRTIRGSDDVIVSEETMRFRTFPWNDRASTYRGDHGEVIERILDPRGEARTTTFAYFEDEGLDRAAFGRLRLVEYPDGSWERYVYDLRNGELLRTIRPYGDGAPDAPESQCRVSVEEDGVLDDVDGDGKPESIRTLISRALGLETQRSHQVVFSKPIEINGVLVKRTVNANCAVPGAAWNAADNIVSETRTYAMGPDSGKIHSILSPDGTMSFTSYERTDGRLTTTTDSGEPDVGGTEIINGRRTVTVTHPLGSVQSTAIYDIATGLLLDRSETFAEDFDEFGRPTMILHLDGTAEQYVYGCCGIESYIDRSGTVETYAYDFLKRRTSTTRAGITSITDYDAAGRTRESRQESREGNNRTAFVSEFSPSGRLLVTWDLLDRPTRFSEMLNVDNHNVRTTTLPDLSTRVEVYHRDGRALGMSGTAQYPVAYEYGVVADSHDGKTFNAQTTTEIRVGLGGERTEWTRTYTDMLGRVYKTELPTFDGLGSVIALNFFDAAGRLVRQVDFDGVTTLYSYDAEGRLLDTALDANGNGVIDYAGTDRISRTTFSVVDDPVRGTLERSTSVVLLSDSDVTATIVAETETNRATRTVWSRNWGRETASQTEYLGDGAVQVVAVSPDGVTSTSVVVDGFRTTQSVVNEAGESFGTQTFGYDEWGRLVATVDARNGETTQTYDAGDRVSTITSPAPDEAHPRQTTSFVYDARDRVTTVTLPDGAAQFRSYYPTGETKREWGARQYPVDYTYDNQGRLRTMTTWQDFAGSNGAATTTWSYNPFRGAHDRKTYDDGSHIDFTYSPGGRLDTRTWARATVTTYNYDSLTGDLSAIDYSDATPGITFRYDRAGRIETKTDAIGTCIYGYNEDVMTSETHTSGLLAGHTLRRVSNLGRLASLSVENTTGPVYQANYGYRDNLDRETGRLTSVGFGSAHVTYGYEPDSQLLRDTVWSEGSTERVRATTLFDRMNRLVNRTTTNPDVSGEMIRLFDYGYNAANQRERATLETGESWQYGYDELGQVTSGAKNTVVDETIPGYDFGYRFDDIGNRESTVTNGRTADYVVNLLNQYEQREIPRVIDVLGEGPIGGDVTVNGLQSIRTSKTGTDGYFYTPYPAEADGRHDLTIRNTVPGALDETFDEQRVAYQSTTPEVFTHDADGNLTSDWRWTYTWNGENRLISMETTPAAVASGVPQQRLEFVYDYQGRRTAKRVFAWDQSSVVWVLSSDHRFLYDGWNLLLEISDLPSEIQSTKAFVWGLDLSGSLQGAGGVGGLVLIKTDAASAVPAYDGNGNVIACLDLANSAPLAEFEYGPFGETLRATGSFAESAAFRFSTKFSDIETGLVYYGFRYYNSSSGHWLSRDPILENGGPNLYGIVGNAPTVAIDTLGLAGYFFDGTGNNRAVDTWGGSGNAPTNIALLYDLYKQRARYYEGVGTGPELRLPGLVIGTGGEERLNRAMGHWKEDYGSGERVIDVFGFSRGAAIAREFVNRISDCYPDVEVRFLGIFDTVGQFGAPDGGNYNKGIRLTIPENVGFTAHAVARHEFRTWFPLTSIRDYYYRYRQRFNAGALSYEFAKTNNSLVTPESMVTSNFTNSIEQAFDGAHSDIGGGYQDARNLTALHWMWGLAHAQGVPLNELSSHPDFGRLKQINKPHESRDDLKYRQDFLLNWLDQRKVFTPAP